MNKNHPKKGSKIRVDPIKDKKAIKNIKAILKDSPLNYALFVFGINTGLRANEILSIKTEEIKGLVPGDDLHVFQKKTKKTRIITINKAAHEALQKLAEQRKERVFLFSGRKGDSPLKVPTLSTMVKNWCSNVGLKGNYGSHSLRKTWGYWQRVEAKTSLPLLMEAFGHSTQQQTLRYLGIQDEEIQDVYKGLEL